MIVNQKIPVESEPPSPNMLLITTLEGSTWKRDSLILSFAEDPFGAEIPVSFLACCSDNNTSTSSNCATFLYFKIIAIRIVIAIKATKRELSKIKKQCQ